MSIIQSAGCVPRRTAGSLLAASFLLALGAVAPPASAQYWNEVASMPGPGRHHPVNFVLGGYGYAVTGSTSTSGTSDDFYRYDPEQDSWTVLPDFPGVDRSYAYGGASDGLGYLGFGSAGSALADLWQYDPSSQQWTQLPSLPASGRQHPAFVITDDAKIFVGMGNAAGNFRDWWEYDIATQQWTRKADLPGPARHHPYYFNIGRYPYVGFGHGAGIFKDFYRFDPDSNEWTRLADFPGEGRVAGQQFSYNGKGYVLSGQGDDHDYLPTGEFWEYEPAQDTWSPLPAHPGRGRWAPGSFVIGDAVYFMAGETPAQLEHDVWKFDLGRVAAGPQPGAGAAGSLTLAPNPSPGRELRLRNVPAEPFAIELIGVDGRRICDLQASAGTIRLPEQLGRGLYFVAFSSPNGDRIVRRITVL